VKIDENTILTGSDDGFLRGVSIYPNSILSVLGTHADDVKESFPIEKLAISRCKNFAASISHDMGIKFYDISKFVRKREGMKEITMEGFKEEIEEIQEKEISKEEESKEEAKTAEMEIEEEPKRKKKSKKGKKEGEKQEKEEMHQQKMKDFWGNL